MEDKTEQRELLKKLYYSFDHPSAYSSAYSLYREAKKHSKDVSFKDVKKWLSKELAYTLHRPVRRKFKTRRVMVYSKDESWQADLVDLSKLAKQNDGHKHLLVLIDVFSKFAWVRPLPTKSASGIERELKSILLTSKRQPKTLQTDKGSEFLNKSVKQLLQNRNIKLFTTYSERKASVVERFNRTLKNHMFRYFTKQDTRRYVDVLQELVRKYNNTVHRSIKMKPSDVTEGNSPQVWINLYGETKTEKRKPKKPKFNIGDLVRISVERGPFRKGYLEGWSEEIFVVKVTVTGGSVVVYKLMDQNNEELKGTFYTEELQKVLLPSSFRIERIIRKKRQKGGKTLLFVKWSGYPDTFNSYIEEDDLISGSR